jgi:hypothetical protein
LSSSEKLFAATRTDGLGGRLKAIVNAIFLANETGWRFGFTWNRDRIVDNVFHSIDIAPAIFDSTFLEKHYLGEELDDTGFIPLGKTPFSISDLRARSDDDAVSGWICNSFHLTKQMVADESVKVRGNALAFRAIGFTEPIREAIRAAEAVTLPHRIAAIHLRSGDIVHGSYRRRPYFAQKVIPSPLAKAMIRHLQEHGMEVILFGEHRDTLGYLKSETDCRLADEFGAPSPDTGTVRAMIEMVLLSRCTEIYAGSSMFAVMASEIGSASVRSPHDLFGRAGLSHALLAELEENASAYHPREAAYGYLFAYARLPDGAGGDRQEQLLDQAHRLDPENDVYPLKKAVLRFGEGRYAEGEAILSRLYHADDDASCKSAARAIRLLNARNWQGLDWQDDFPQFKAAALAGMPHAAACCAVFLTACGDMPASAEMIDRALSAQPQNPLFRRIARRVRKADRSSASQIPMRRNRAKERLRQAVATCARLLGMAAR